ncbi:hypothetical protein pb186bvf_020545 [Paramecium bursaria]
MINQQFYHSLQHLQNFFKQGILQSYPFINQSLSYLQTMIIRSQKQCVLIKFFSEFFSEFFSVFLQHKNNFEIIDFLFSLIDKKSNTQEKFNNIITCILISSITEQNDKIIKLTTTIIFIYIKKALGVDY